MQKVHFKNNALRPAHTKIFARFIVEISPQIIYNNVNYTSEQNHE